NYAKGLDTLMNISTPIPSEVLLNALNDKGIMVSSKSTCGSKKNEENRTLRALGLDEDHAIRISFDYTNTMEEADYFLSNLKEIIDKYA
ncbi:MAG: cysteine desulfurase, partial [Erysipelotrichaceae bacterium]|nr:cysteine desulfurase [Erysipelotrichaceae bacterium]